MEFPDEIKSAYQQEIDDKNEAKRKRREARALKMNKMSHEQQEENIKKLFWEGSPLKYYAAMRNEKRQVK